MMPNNDLPERFKETEIGPIPVEWEVVRLGEVAALTMGQSPPSSTYNTDGTGLPFLQGKAEFGETCPTPVKWCSRPQKVADRGSVLISVRAPVGDVNVARDDYCIGRGLAAINGSELLDNWFLLYVLILAKRRLEDRGTGSTFKSINKGVLQNFSIPLPPLSEQRRIAHVLNTIQRAIAAQDDLIAAAREVKRSLMQRLFTYGPGPEPVPTKETEIGEMPEHWELQQCQVLCEKITVGVVVRPSSYYVPCGVPAFRSLNIREDRIVTDELVFFSQEINDTKLSKSKLRTGDVLIVRTGYPGTACVVPEEFNGANCIDLVIARPKHSVIKSEYLSRYFNSSGGKSQVLASKTGLAQKHLNVGAAKRTLIPLPPLPEQREIAHILSVVDRKVEAEEQRKAALQALFKAMLHQLMTGQIRVGARHSPQIPL
jgi:type I restriction enzyme S subunit